MFLDSTELLELTNRKRASAQARVLRSMGIEHKIRPDGSVAVLRAHIVRLFGEAMPKTADKEFRFNWSAAGATRAQ